MISLIIPMYNSEQTIKKTLQSVVNQTIAFSEVIVVDNGSSDQSKQIVEEYMKQYPYIHLLSCEKRGVSSARNMGIDACQSPYIGFLDADDILANDYVETIERSIKCYPNVYVHHFNFHQQFKSGIMKENSYFLHDKEMYTGREFMEKTLKYFSFEAKHMVWTFIFKKEFLNQYHLRFNTEMTIFEDILFLNQVWEKNSQIIIIDKSLITYKYIQKSLTNTNDLIICKETFEKLKQQLPVHQNYLKKLSSRILQHDSFVSVWGNDSNYYILKIQYYYQKVKNKIKGKVK